MLKPQRSLNTYSTETARKAHPQRTRKDWTSYVLLFKRYKTIRAHDIFYMPPDAFETNQGPQYNLKVKN